jgi:hypothetical protein
MDSNYGILLNPRRIISFGSALQQMHLSRFGPNQKLHKFTQKITVRCQMHSEMRDRYERPIHTNYTVRYKYLTFLGIAKFKDSDKDPVPQKVQHLY